MSAKLVLNDWFDNRGFLGRGPVFRSIEAVGRSSRIATRWTPGMCGARVLRNALKREKLRL